MNDCSFRNEFKSFWLALYIKRSLVQWVEIISKWELLHLQFDKIIYMYNIRPSYLNNYNLKIVEINLWKNRSKEELGKLLQKNISPNCASGTKWTSFSVNAKKCTAKYDHNKWMRSLVDFRRLVVGPSNIIYIMTLPCTVIWLFDTIMGRTKFWRRFHIFCFLTVSWDISSTINKISKKIKQ